MNCPRCKSRMCRCVDSRQRRGGRYRRYACQGCGEKFSTIERYTPIEEEVTVRYLVNTLQRIEREMKAARMAVKRGKKTAAPAANDREETI